ncbi:MAG: 4'-phosphopantetheinyl transferase superfamily protein [Gluconacetobacter diazotrophicus]|nr:4'-phosphopantetheinyl transferase superfamily protein [Gluconacetobacter diazotrophicus]
MGDGLKRETDEPPPVVRVWSADLDLDDARIAALAGLLDQAESARARRFHFERDRRRFTAARGILRTLLGRCLDVRPDTGVAFSYAGRGKPALAVPGLPDGDRVCFNVSHSDGRALFAIARGREVGIDLEAGARLGNDWPMLARRIFSAREQAELAAVPSTQRRAAFLNGWTRKEAYLKATAQGIVDGLTAIEVTLDPGNPPTLLAVPAGQDVCAWTLYDLRTDERFAAALVVAGKGARIERLTF